MIEVAQVAFMDCVSLRMTFLKLMATAAFLGFTAAALYAGARGDGSVEYGLLGAFSLATAVLAGLAIGWWWSVLWRWP
jgi:hypothetical protein